MYNSIPWQPFSFFSPRFGFRADGGYYNVKHVEAEWKLGWEVAFELHNNFEVADLSRYLVALFSSLAPPLRS